LTAQEAGQNKITMTTIPLQPGTLQARTAEAIARARQSGALRPIETVQHTIQEQGIPFLVRLLAQSESEPSALDQKPKPQEPLAHNPFLPYDSALFVTDVSDTHLCLLNKFNVMEQHLLIVTRSFEAQETLLTLADFTALWRCLAEIDGLGFYNGGPVAGASQPHKHLQLVPTPFAPGGPAVPLLPALTQVQLTGNVGTSPALPFVHAIAPVDPRWVAAPDEAARATLDLYYTLLDQVGLPPDPSQDQQPGPYNLLLTRQWLWLVPRSQETVEEMSVNALGFAGSLFARNTEQLDQIQTLGPLEILRRVGVARENRRT
jgi:sulfate adenylyltransferase (ADP) / ATP adenylyltransferase